MSAGAVSNTIRVRVTHVGWWSECIRVAKPCRPSKLTGSAEESEFQSANI